jgi:hypothetical protein
MHQQLSQIVTPLLRVVTGLGRYDSGIRGSLFGIFRPWPPESLVKSDTKTLALSKQFVR